MMIRAAVGADPRGCGDQVAGVPNIVDALKPEREAADIQQYI
jgi:hypothetical protein